MSRVIKSITRICGVLIAAAAIAGLYGAHAWAGTVPIQGCVIELGKQVNFETTEPFDFTADYASAGDEDFSIFPGETFDVEIDPGDSVVVSENVPSGWRLTNVICGAVSQGFNIFVNGDNQLVANCIEFGAAQCFFVNEVTGTNIPTLSEWGMIAAAAGLMIVGVFFAVRRRRAAA